MQGLERQCRNRLRIKRHQIGDCAHGDHSAVAYAVHGGGLAELSHQQFGYDKIKSAGVNVALSAATAVDPEKRVVTLADGTKLNYERLVVSPGIDFRSGAIQGYDRGAMDVMPPAYNDGAQVASGGTEGSVNVWNLSRADQLATITHPDTVSAVTLSPSGDRAARSSAAIRSPRARRASIARPR